MRITGMSGRRLTSLAAVGGLAAIAMVSCGGGSSKSAVTTSTPTSGATPTTAELGTGPATATLTMGGDKVLAGPLTPTSISCGFPGLDGSTITVLARTVDPNAQTFIIVTGAAVHVRVASGSGTTYLERNFNGKGVSGYDAARGAHLDVALQESVVAKGRAKTLPAATSIKGDVHCGGQRPGSSTIVLSGETGIGAISGTLSSVRVTCATDTLGKVVTAVGIAKVGAGRALVFVDGQPNAFTLVVEPAGATTALVFKSSGSTAATTTGRGMHVSGNAIEQPVAGKSAHTVHAAGDAVCGASGTK